ncbi:alginate lyase family protein [Kitasatospora sp. NPDC094011]|uniref:alginate lyase family protein n=1 Tax=Kitasatospora sp. NPDC094011 TaxID=3364090 RepID=UPI00380F15DA
MQIDADGSQPQERTRTRTWHYFTFNLVALTRLAQLGRHLGIDLWDHRTPAGSDLYPVRPAAEQLDDISKA